MKKTIILSLFCSAIIFSATGCSELLRPLTVRYQCHSAEVPNPRTTGDFVSVSRYHSNKGEFDCAYTAAEEAYRLKKDNPKAIIARGFAHLGLKEYSSALSDFRIAIMLDARQPEAFIGRSRVFAVYEDWENAILDNTVALEMAANDKEFSYQVPFWINNRGLLYLKKGDTENALQDYSKAIALRPDFYYFYDNRAKLYRQLGKIDEALADEEKSAKLVAEKEQKKAVTFKIKEEKALC